MHVNNLVDVTLSHFCLVFIAALSEGNCRAIPVICRVRDGFL